MARAMEKTVRPRAGITLLPALGSGVAEAPAGALEVTEATLEEAAIEAWLNTD